MDTPDAGETRGQGTGSRGYVSGIFMAPPQLKRARRNEGATVEEAGNEV